MIGFAACVSLCAAGHLVRDGWPATGSTQLARGLGGLGAILGGLFLHPIWLAIALGLCVWIGFYSDQKHGAGQGGHTLKDAMYLAISGITSLVPLALAGGFLFNWWYLLVPLVGLVKVPLWMGFWRLPVQKLGAWFQPTRLAAISFGAIVGSVVALL